jgi:hypothetical protein
MPSLALKVEDTLEENPSFWRAFSGAQIVPGFIPYRNHPLSSASSRNDTE